MVRPSRPVNDSAPWLARWGSAWSQYAWALRLAFLGCGGAAVQVTEVAELVDGPFLVRGGREPADRRLRGLAGAQVGRRTRS